MGASGITTDAMKNIAANAYAGAGLYLTLLRALTLQTATTTGATTFSVDLSVQAGDRVVFDQGLATQEEVIAVSVSGTGPYTVTVAAPGLQFAHSLAGPNAGLQSHLPLSSTTVHEVASITRTAASWGSPSPAGVVGSSASAISVPSGSKVGALALFSASTAGTYYDATAVAGQTYASTANYIPVWTETVA